ncbi:MAG: APC family permease [Actinomycetota bacterium]
MTSPPSRLHRAIGVRAATVVGLGAMLGTGVFAVWTPAYALAGPWILVGLLIAGAVAILNAVSTVRLARVLPESGGAYAYGRAFVGRPAGLIAGYAFVVGKSASAGAAALTIGAYAWPGYERLVGLAAVAVALALDLRGIVRSVRVSAVLVAIVLLVLATLAIAWWSTDSALPSSTAATPSGLDLLAASGLLFVAFAGYARITVLGEEVRDPARTIPRAVVASFAIVFVVYVVIAAMVVAAVLSGVALSAAPLADIAQAAAGEWLIVIVRIGAVVAAGAVLVSLLAGVGRTLFAMADRGDAPRPLSAVAARTRTPYRAEIAAAVLAALVVAVGGIGFALGLSAATVFLYYSVAHLASWRQGARVVPVAGLALCLLLTGGLLVAALG